MYYAMLCQKQWNEYGPMFYYGKLEQNVNLSLFCVLQMQKCHTHCHGNK